MKRERYIEEIKDCQQGDYQCKKIKWNIEHPLVNLERSIDIDYQGVIDSEGRPTGLGLVSYAHNGNKVHKASFRGACHFVKGVITGAGFFINYEKSTYLFENLRNGIIDGPCKYFYGDGEFVTIDSTRERIDVSGKLIYNGYTAKKAADGFGRGFKSLNGGIFTGQWHQNLKFKGELSELQPDGSRREYEVEYDYQNDILRDIGHDQQVPTRKVLI